VQDLETLVGGMIVITPSSMQIAETMRRVRESGDYKKSIRGKPARQVGFLGEIIVRDYLVSRGYRYQETRTTQNDALLNGRKIEVKSKERSVPPKSNYEGSIAAYNKEHQDVDAHIFVSFVKSTKYRKDDVRRLIKAFVVGVADNIIVERNAYLRPEGMVDASNGFDTPMECYNLRFDCLIPLDRYCEQWAA
jgi:hypothetical protein